jgi:transposase
MVDAAAQAPVVRRPRQAPRYKSQPDIGTVEIEVDGVTIRVWQGADANMIAALVQALKASR